MSYHDDIMLLPKKLEALKKNDEWLTKVEDKAKYAGAYNKLRSEIESLIFNGLKIFSYPWKFEDEKEKEAVLSRFYQSLDRFWEDSKQPILDIAFESYDENLIFTQAELLLGTYEVDYYYPYFRSKCKVCEKSDFKWADKEEVNYQIYNPLLDAWWHPTSHVWVTWIDDKPGFCGFCMSPSYTENIKSLHRQMEIDKERVDAFWKEHYAKCATVSTSVYQQAFFA